MSIATPVFRFVRSLWRQSLDAVYPRICLSCDEPLLTDASLSGSSAWFCTTCLGELVPVEVPYCSKCGEPFDGAMTEAFTCKNCVGRRVAYDFAISGFKSVGPLRDVIHHYKYRRDLFLRAGLADLLSYALKDPRLAKENLQQWLLVPVPLHYTRQLKRGFNQSWELCRRLSSLTGIPAAQVLSRTSRTSSQAQLHRKKRLQNLKGAFTVRPRRFWRHTPPLKGRSILLVDDILTTGATAHECAKILKQCAGVEKVVVISAARG